MATEILHSPAPWTWTDFGVLSDANGEAILDAEDWNVSPEDAIVLSVAPELLAWVTRIVTEYPSALPREEVAAGRALVKRATDPKLRP